jgi:hypothetical protein
LIDYPEERGGELRERGRGGRRGDWKETREE